MPTLGTDGLLHWELSLRVDTAGRLRVVQFNDGSYDRMFYSKSAAVLVKEVVFVGCDEPGDPEIRAAQMFADRTAWTPVNEDVWQHYYVEAVLQEERDVEARSGSGYWTTPAGGWTHVGWARRGGIKYGDVKDEWGPQPLLTGGAFTETFGGSDRRRVYARHELETAAAAVTPAEPRDRLRRGESGSAPWWTSIEKIKSGKKLR